MDAKNYWNRALPLIKKKGLTERKIETLIARNRYPEADESENIARELGTSNTYLVTGTDINKPDMTGVIRQAEKLLGDLKQL
ncbi:MAG: hypothetical protein LBJ41_01705 [Treponema sp.]|jgi:hypothetical protein|nr:hypothetical protein [Treponema sp.]